MLTLLYALAACLSASIVGAQADELPKPTLEFNVSLALGALNVDSESYRAWATVYENTLNATNGTVGRGPARLVGLGRGGIGTPTVSFQAAARNVYVYGELGPGGSQRQPELRFNYGSDYYKSPGAEGSLLGKMTDIAWFKYNWKFTVFADSYKPTISDIIVTTGLETTAKSLSEVNVTIWPFIEDGDFSSHFQWINSPLNGYPTWNTTSSYAAATGDENLATLKDLGVEGAVQGRGGKIKIVVPNGTAWVGLNVTRGPAFGDLVIDESPKIAGYSSATLRTSAQYYGPNELVWFRTLNPRLQYNLTLWGMPDSDTKREGFAVNSVTFYSSGAVNPGSSEAGIVSPGGPGASDWDVSSGGTGETASPKVSDGGAAGGGPNVGAIAGGVVGGVLGLALIGTLVWYLIRRRRRRAYQAQEESEPKFEVDEPPVTPFTGRASGAVHDAKGQVAAPEHIGQYEVEQQEQEVERPQPPHQRHRALDGGSIPGTESEAMDPPLYDPSWGRRKH